MYLITIRSRVNPKSQVASEYRDVGGAYVNCYISFKDFAAAEHLAKWLIRREGWIPEKRTEARHVQKRHFKTKKEKQYYSDVIKYGWSLVFAMWPADTPDHDVDHEAKRKRKRRHAPRARSNKSGMKDGVKRRDPHARQNSD